MHNPHLTFAQFFKHKDLLPYLYQLSLKMSEGHICIPINNIPQLDDQPYFEHYPIKSFDEIAAPELIGSADDLLKPFIVHQGALYTQRYFKYESKIFSFLKACTQQSSPTNLPFTASTISSLFGYNPHETNWQAVAAVNAMMHRFSIITGGPGTGKTTTIAKLLYLLFLQNKDIKVAIAAPTGKASARMSESLQRAAHQFDEATQTFFKSLIPNTLHRLLGYIPNSIYYKHNTDYPLPYDVVIIDESSMVDVALFAKLVAAIGPDTKLILLGDKDQLASVEAGSIFGDICQAVNLNAFTPSHLQLLNQYTLINPNDEKFSKEQFSNHIVALQQSHRFTSDSGIGRFAKGIIESDSYILEEFLGLQDKAIHFDQNYDADYITNFAKSYLNYIQTEDIFEALLAFNQIKILCAIKDGPTGLHQINKLVEQSLAHKQWIQPYQAFYEHKPIMITKNDYNLGLYNGDIGIIRKDQNGTLKAWFIENEAERRVKCVLPGFITQYDTVYAMTIHKSQGSEFDEVLMVLPDQYNPILTKELIYTGVTRAKNKVYIQSDKEIFLHACQQPVSRGSGLKERLKTI